MVVETTNFLATLQYFAPYIRAALAKYFMYHKQHILIIYDDLSKQAQAYQQMWHTHKLLDRLNCESEVKIVEK